MISNLNRGYECAPIFIAISHLNRGNESASNSKSRTRNSDHRILSFPVIIKTKQSFKFGYNLLISHRIILNNNKLNFEITKNVQYKKLQHLHKSVSAPHIIEVYMYRGCKPAK